MINVQTGMELLNFNVLVLVAQQLAFLVDIVILIHLVNVQVLGLPVDLKVMEVFVLQAVNVLRVCVVDRIVVVVKEDPVDALIVIQTDIVVIVVPIIIDRPPNVILAVVVKQV